MSGLERRLRRLEERFARVEEMQSLTIVVQFVNADKEVVSTRRFEIGNQKALNGRFPASRRWGWNR